MASIVLLDLMGGVALLLWGLHMVRSGIMRAFGSELQSILSTALSNRFLAPLAGLTALLQSSTATGLLMTSFAARGLVNLVPALAVALLLAEPCPGACLRVPSTSAGRGGSHERGWHPVRGRNHNGVHRREQVRRKRMPMRWCRS